MIIHRLFPLLFRNLGIRAVCARFLKIRGEPRQIAYGLALGIFIGMTPFMGFHTIMALLVAAACRWNKFSAVAGILITNPLTAPFIYPVTYVVGNAVLGISNLPHPEKVLSLEAAADLIQSSPAILMDLFAGGIIIGLPLSIVAYWVALAAVEKYRRKAIPRL
jgi:hypothetical protein